MKTNWIDTAEYDDMKSVIVSVFNALEWEGLTTPSSTTAKKSFTTIAGVNECFIYLELYDENHWYLKASYETEGNNILSTCTSIIGKNFEKDGINFAVNKFICEITERINNCRMVRLAKK